MRDEKGKCFVTSYEEAQKFPVKKQKEYTVYYYAREDLKRRRRSLYFYMLFHIKNEVLFALLFDLIFIHIHYINIISISSSTYFS